MNFLPQKKKSAEEISKLRESLGIPGAPEIPQETAPQAPVPEEPVAPPPTRAPKPVKSLRFSEWYNPSAPREISQPPPDSKLPTYRHTDRQITEIRRSTSFEAQPIRVNPKFIAAPIWLIAIGYALAIGGFFYKSLPLAVTIVFAAGAISTALYIFLRHPFSRHHAGFIAVLTALSSVHFLPIFQNAP